MLRNPTGILCLAALLATASATAQTSMGGVSGMVVDSSGARVPGATVTLTNTATSVASVRQTNDSGFYTFVNVRPGSYTLMVELQGFTKASVEAFTAPTSPRTTTATRPSPTSSREMIVTLAAFTIASAAASAAT